MSAAIEESKPFRPGTTGWTVEDLDDREIERRWFAGRYEIVEGVLATMPPAYFDGSLPVGRLIRFVQRHLEQGDLSGNFATQVDLVLAPRRVARVDVVFLTPNDRKRQEQHDQETKRQWYEQFGIPNYWMLNAYERTFRCLVLDRGTYRIDPEGSDEAELRPSLFPGLVVRLKDLWE